MEVDTTRQKRSKLPTPAQMKYLQRGLDQPGGKLPLFDENGQRIKEKMIRTCIDKGWCEPWYRNPIKEDWLVCRLTDSGRRVAGAQDDPPAHSEML